MGTANKRSRGTRESLMIEQRELEQLRGEWSLESGVIEKDYVLVGCWPALHNMRHCRRRGFSRVELVFASATTRPTVLRGPRFHCDERRFGRTSTLIQIFKEIVEWVRENSGLELVIDESSFRVHQNRRGNPTTQGRVGYRGPNLHRSCPRSRLT